MAKKPKVPDYLESLRADPQKGREINFQSPGERAPGIAPRANTVRWGGFFLGLALALAVFFSMLPVAPHNAALTAATALLMAVWWMTEALPIPATALMPLIIFPALSVPVEGDDGELTSISFDSIGASYGNNVIFLFLGGFLIALSMQRWNLHRRVALLVLRVMPSKPGAMIAGFMIATGFISMWVSNTATAVMMLPIGMSVLGLVTQVMNEQKGDAKGGGEAKGGAQTVVEAVKTNFGTALMLGIAYGASLGSLGTLIGTPPNALLAGYMSQEHDVTIGFFQWMVVGVPLSVVFMFIAWFLLVKVLFKPEMKEIPGGREFIQAELAKLGKTSKGEWRVLIIFALTAFSWIFFGLWEQMGFGETPPISDAGIAMTAGLLLFLLPGGAARGVKLLDWKSAKELPWDVLLLFGGGLALSGMFSTSGLTDTIAELMGGVTGISLVVIIALLATAILFLTELTSNTATAATFIPIAGGVALGLGVDPLLLTAPVALAATCAFMLPVATPPNAVAYGSGYVTIPQMVKGGLWLNLIGIVLITLTCTTLLLWVFGLAL